jgi:hypothetical protein
MAITRRPARAKTSVSWFAPLQLLRTAQQVAIATVFGRNADARVIEALARPDAGSPAGAGEKEEAAPRSRSSSAHEYSGFATPFWIDYVADTGDGWDATYTVAYHLAQDELQLRQSENESGGPVETTRRGDALVFGGDEVYPIASYEEYERRLVLPYSYAFPPLPDAPGSSASADVAATSSEPTTRQPDVFAIPGNHDWYDSLVSFTRLFCSRQSFAGWRAPQERSYFALRLPKGWWLIGTDVQLGSDIDRPQRAFFEALAETMAPDDKVVICHAEPHWLYETIYPEAYRYRTVRELEESFGDRIKLFLSGDSHFYTRHEGPGGVQKIIAGGGGAFMHFTYGPDDRALTRMQVTPDPARPGETTTRIERTGFEKRAAFPSPARSVLLCLANPLTFHVKNPSFGIATALAYAVTAEALIHPGTAARSLEAAASEAATRVFTDPFSLFWLVSVVLGVIFFTDTHARSYRWTGGFLHAVAHAAAAAVLGWQAAVLTQTALGSTSLAQAAATAALTAIGGYAVGPLILALYLTISLLLFRRHRSDASSALRGRNYKNFLRLRIDESGGLTVFPIGIRRVATRWGSADEASPSRSKLRPVNGSRPFLIEEPLVFRAPER